MATAQVTAIELRQPSALRVCPVALRQELALYQEPADVNSSTFLRFVIRLSERLDVDIPREHYEQLATINGAFEYIRKIG